MVLATRGAARGDGDRCPSASCPHVAILTRQRGSICLLRQTKGDLVSKSDRTLNVAVIGLGVQLILDAIYRSAKTGREIRIR